MDTVIFKKNEQFSFYSYKSNKPFFISIWYPAKKSTKEGYLLFKDYFNFQRNADYNLLLDSLRETYHHNFIKYAVCINISLHDFDLKVKFDSSKKELYNDILETKVCAKRNLPKPKTALPCIVYHHGAQSASFDNNVFCEFMASHGFVVISSNYNLPAEESPKTLTTSTEKQFDEISDLQYVIEFTKKQSFVDTVRMIAVGHSLGAQTEIRHDNTSLKKPFKIILSLHTTLEDADLKVAKKYWPSFTYLYENNCKNSTTPTLLLAPTHLGFETKKDSITQREVIQKLDTLYPDFTPFRNNTTTPYTFVTVKHNVTHDGFIALGNLRFPFRNKYNLIDKIEVMKQQESFERIVMLAHEIITSTLNGSTMAILNTKLKYFKFETTAGK